MGRRLSLSLRVAVALLVALFGLVLFHPTWAFALPPASPAPSASASVHAPPAPDKPALPRKPVAVLTTEDGARGPVVLASHDGTYAGTFEIGNAGGEPLLVSRVAIRGDDEDVRAPARLSAHLVEGGATATIAPGTRAKVVVTWAPERSARVRQVYAHVVVTSNDEEAGEVAIGVHAEMASLVPFVADHLLSWAILLPLAGAALIVLLALLGKGSERTPRDVALATLVAVFSIAVVIAFVFRGDVTRLDGNDGFQLIEHGAWVRPLGVEYFVGVDGLSAPMVLVTALVALLGCAASEGVADRQPAYYALYLVLVTGLLGVFVSLDLFLFYTFWGVTLVPLYFLVSAWGTGAGREDAALKLALFAAAASALMLVAFLALYSGSDRTFLVDGTPAAHTFSIPELARVSFAGKKLVVFGVAFVKIVWVLLFAAFAVGIPMFPLHTWLPDASARAPAPVAALIAALFTKMGAYALLRVSLAILPEATQWAAGAVSAFGAAGVVYGAVCAMAQDDVRRMLGYACVSQMGFCLVGIGSLTPQGVAGSIFMMVSHAIVVTLLFLVAGAIEERVGRRGMRAGLGGIAREAPLLAAIGGLGLVASLGAPGLSGFWGEVLPLLGAFPSHRAIAAVAAIGLVASASYHLGAFRSVFLGSKQAAWRASPELDRYGGRFADVTARELATLAPLALLVVVLGVWPVPLLALVAGGVHDAVSFVDPAGPDQIASLLRGASHALAALP
jgi:NADH-quinone oxidoreductase subunit M